MTEFETIIRELAVSLGRIEERQTGVITQMGEVKSAVSDFQEALIRQNNAIAQLQYVAVTKEDFSALSKLLSQFPCATGCAWEASQKEGNADKRALSINLKTGIWLAVIGIPIAIITSLLTVFLMGA